MKHALELFAIGAGWACILPIVAFALVTIVACRICCRWAGYDLDRAEWSGP